MPDAWSEHDKYGLAVRQKFVHKDDMGMKIFHA